MRTETDLHLKTLPRPDDINRLGVNMPRWPWRDGAGMFE